MRWTVTVYYLTDAGPIDVDHEVDELSAIHSLVEAGPDWRTIERIEIRLSHPDRITIEQSLAE